MDANAPQTSLSSRTLPSGIVQNDDVRSLGLECFGRNYEHAPAYFGNCNRPRPFETAYIALAHARVDREKRHSSEARRQFCKWSVLLDPSDRVGRSWCFWQHRDQWRHRRQQRATAIITIRARRSVKDCAYDLQAAIDSRSRDACGDSVGDKSLERPVVNSMYVEVPNICGEQSDVPDGDVC